MTPRISPVVWSRKPQPNLRHQEWGAGNPFAGLLTGLAHALIYLALTAIGLGASILFAAFLAGWEMP